MTSTAILDRQFAGAVERQLAGDLAAAERAYRGVLRRLPGNVPSLLNLGLVLLAKGAAGQALALFRRAVALMPTHADAQTSLGAALETLGRTAEAETAYRRALALRPDHADANYRLAALFRARGEDETAARYYRQPLQTEPGHLRALDELGDVLLDDGQLDAAREAYDRAEEVSPSYGRRIKRALMLPAVYRSEADLGVRRARFFGALGELEGRRERIASPLAELSRLPFALADQGFDDRAAFERLSNLVRPSLPELVRPRSKTASGRAPRIGLIVPWSLGPLSAAAMLALAPLLRAEGLDLTLLDLRGTAHGTAAERGTLRLPRQLATARQAIADLRLDTLLHGELGADPLAYFLAHSRLAPVQINLGGASVTSGVRTVDYYLSDRFSDEADSDALITERLVLLDWFPRLWPRAAFAEPKAGPTRAALDLPAQGALYFCPLRPARLHPGFDQTLAGLLAGDPEGHLILLEEVQSAQPGATLRERLAETLGPAAARVVFLPPAAASPAMAVATVVLDGYPCGGGEALIEAFLRGVPVVTRPGRFGRARLGQALYRALEIAGPVAAGADDHVRQAVRLARDEAARRELGAAMRVRAKDLIDNPAGARALAGFLHAVTGRAG